MADERVYTINLRSEIAKVPRYKKAKKAVSGVRNFLIKHMKNKNVKLGKYLNKKLLERGRKNPVHKVQVKVWKDKVKEKDKEIEIVRAELVGAPVEKKEELKEDKAEKALKELEKKTEEILEEKEKVKKEGFTEKEKEEILEKEPEKEVKQIEEERMIKPEQEEKERHRKIISKTEKPYHEKKK